jgi:hypothetical protein
MADSYPEDVTSEAEEEVAGQAVEGAVEEEENNSGAEEEEQDGGIRADEEQIPMNLHRYWVKCHIKDAHVQALEDEGTVAPRAESQWRTDHKALVPAQNSTKILMLKSHVERGLSMPPSHFFSNLLKFYGLQLQHIAPNSLVSVAGYATFCKDSLKFGPGWISSSYTSQCSPIMRMTGFYGLAERYVSFLGGPRNIPSTHLWIPLWDGEDHGSTWRTKLLHLKTVAFILSRI